MMDTHGIVKVSLPAAVFMYKILIIYIFCTDYVAIGPRFSNLVLQALLVLLRKIPPVVVSSILAMRSQHCVLYWYYRLISRVPYLLE